jgi:hypothetical protein
MRVKIELEDVFALEFATLIYALQESIGEAAPVQVSMLANMQEKIVAALTTLPPDRIEVITKKERKQ